MIDVINSIFIYEENGKEQKDYSQKRLSVESHWNRREYVVLKLPDGTKLTVLAKDLEAAIKNATNTARY